MRSAKLFYLLVIFAFAIIVPCVPVLADADSHPPTLIIPTKYRYLLLDMVQDAEKRPLPMITPLPVTPVPTPASPGPAASVSADDAGIDTEALLAALQADQSYSGYGRGYIQTNFDVSFEEQDSKVDNHERLTARGLFDVHVSHGFA